MRAETLRKGVRLSRRAAFLPSNNTVPAVFMLIYIRGFSILNNHPAGFDELMGGCGRSSALVWRSPTGQSHGTWLLGARILQRSPLGGKVEAAALPPLILERFPLIYLMRKEVTNGDCVFVLFPVTRQIVSGAWILP